MEGWPAFYFVYRFCQSKQIKIPIVYLYALAIIVMVVDIEVVIMQDITFVPESGDEEDPPYLDNLQSSTIIRNNTLKAEGIFHQALNDRDSEVYKWLRNKGLQYKDIAKLSKAVYFLNDRQSYKIGSYVWWQYVIALSSFALKILPMLQLGSIAFQCGDFAATNQNHNATAFDDYAYDSTACYNNGYFVAIDVATYFTFFITSNFLGVYGVNYKDNLQKFKELYQNQGSFLRQVFREKLQLDKDGNITHISEEFMCLQYIRAKVWLIISTKYSWKQFNDYKLVEADINLSIALLQELMDAITTNQALPLSIEQADILAEDIARNMKLKMHPTKSVFNLMLCKNYKYVKFDPPDSSVLANIIGSHWNTVLKGETTESVLDSRLYQSYISSKEGISAIVWESKSDYIYSDILEYIGRELERESGKAGQEAFSNVLTVGASLFETAPFIANVNDIPWMPAWVRYAVTFGSTGISFAINTVNDIFYFGESQKFDAIYNAYQDQLHTLYVKGLITKNYNAKLDLQVAQTIIAMVFYKLMRQHELDSESLDIVNKKDLIYIYIQLFKSITNVAMDSSLQHFGEINPEEVAKALSLEVNRGLTMSCTGILYSKRGVECERLEAIVSNIVKQHQSLCMQQSSGSMINYGLVDSRVACLIGHLNGVVDLVRSLNNVKEIRRTQSIKTAYADTVDKTIYNLVHKEVEQYGYGLAHEAFNIVLDMVRQSHKDLEGTERKNTKGIYKKICTAIEENLAEYSESMEYSIGI